MPSSALNKKVSLWCGDITRLEIDAIVNSVLEGYGYVPPTKSVFVAVCKAGGPMLEKKMPGATKLLILNSCGDQWI